jgi:hypothetical protein
MSYPPIHNTKNQEDYQYSVFCSKPRNLDNLYNSQTDAKKDVTLHINLQTTKKEVVGVVPIEQRSTGICGKVNSVDEYTTLFRSTGTMHRRLVVRRFGGCTRSQTSEHSSEIEFTVQYSNRLVQR